MTSGGDVARNRPASETELFNEVEPKPLLDSFRGLRQLRGAVTADSGELVR